jgi:N-acetylneuraminate synthase
MRFGCKDLPLGPDSPCFIIAEIGVNHNGDIETAHRMVDAAVAAGADVIKFQAFKSSLEISRFAEKTDYQKEHAPDSGSQLELCAALELSEKDLLSLFAYCDKHSIAHLCAAFEDSSLDFLLDTAKLRTIKIPSSEVTNLPFLHRIGKTGADAILSTGASTLAEVAVAVEVLRSAGCGELMIFHCVSEYPAPLEQVNLRAMYTMREAFGCAIGFSDHTVGIDAAIAAAALGAAAIEKHFTLDRTMPGPDHQASIEPGELAALVRSTRAARLCLGTGIKEPMPCETANRPLIRKSLVVTRDLAAGTRLTIDMIAAKRPAAGMEPALFEHIIGMELRVSAVADQPLTWDMVRAR